MMVLSPVTSHSFNSLTISVILVLGTMSLFPRAQVFIVAAEGPLPSLSFKWLAWGAGWDLNLSTDLLGVPDVLSSSEEGWCWW